MIQDKNFLPTALNIESTYLDCMIPMYCKISASLINCIARRNLSPKKIAKTDIRLFYFTVCLTHI